MLSIRQLVILILVTIGSIIFSCIALIPLAIGFLPGFAVVLYYSNKMGVNRATILKAIMFGFRRVKGVLWILTFVGLTIPSWTASGTVPLMINIGLSLINSTYFLISVFIIMSIVSMILGTSSGTLSAIGLPLIGLGAFLNIPLPLIAGALVSGAFVGDRTSPLSSANQLVASCTGVSIQEHGRGLLPTTIGTMIVSCIFFLILDLLGGWKSVIPVDLSYSISYSSNWLLLPPILLITAIILRLNAKTAFMIAIVAAIFLGTIYQGINISQWISFLLHGYHSAEISIFQGKGLFSMLPLMSFIVITGAFNGILEETKMIQPYFEKILGRSTSLSIYTLRACILGLGMNLLCCNQTMPIMITSTNLLPIWSTQFSATHLSRVVSDSSLILSGLIPWNLLALVCSAILGITVIEYLPYAVFLWSAPIITQIWSIYLECTAPVEFYNSPTNTN